MIGKYQVLTCTHSSARTTGSPARTFQHSLLLQLDAVTSGVKAAELNKADVDVTDIEQAAAALPQRGASFVVS